MIEGERRDKRDRMVTIRIFILEEENKERNDFIHTKDEIDREFTL